MPINAGKLSEFKENELIPLKVAIHNGCNIRDFPTTKHQHYVACAVETENETTVYICENVPDMYVFSRQHFIGEISGLQWLQISKENLEKYNIETNDQYIKPKPTSSSFSYKLFGPKKTEPTEDKSTSTFQNGYRGLCAWD